MTKTLWMLAGPIRWNVLGSVIVGLCVTLSYVGQGVLLALALGAVFRAHDMARAAECVGGLLALVVVRGRALLWLAGDRRAGHGAAHQGEHARAAPRKTHRARPELCQLAGERQDPADHRRRGGGGRDLFQPVCADRVRGGLRRALLVLAALAVVDPWSALVLVPFIVIIPVFSRTFQRWRRGRSRGLHAVRAEFGAYLLDSLQGLVTLKAFSATFRRRQVLVERAVELRQEAMRTLSVSLARGGVTGLLSMGGVATLLAWNSWRVADGTLPAVVLFMTLFLAREAFRPLDRLEREFHAALNGVTAAPAIAGLLDAAASINEPASLPVPPPTKSDVSVRRRHLRL